MIDAVLFDMDGVLLVTERIGVTAMREAAAALGYPMADELYYRTLGVTNAQARAIYMDALGPEYPYDKAVRGFLTRFSEINKEGKIPYKDGAVEALTALKAAGVRTALATSTERWLVEEYMAQKPELSALLDVKICGGEARRSKPAPDIYLLAAERLGVAPERCAGVEDSLNGVRAIRAAGMTCVMVPDLLAFDERFAPYVDVKLGSLRELPGCVAARRG